MANYIFSSGHLTFRQKNFRFNLMARQTHGANLAIRRLNGHQPFRSENGNSEFVTSFCSKSQSTTAATASCQVIECEFHICHGFG